MSHRVSSRPALKDMGRTCRAFERLGWKVEANATERSGYYGPKRFPFVARNPKGGYDIGLEIDPKTKEVVMHHESMLYLPTFFGEDLSLLKKEFTKLTLLEETEKRLGTCSFLEEADGSISVEIEVDVLV